MPHSIDKPVLERYSLHGHRVPPLRDDTRGVYGLLPEEGVKTSAYRCIGVGNCGSVWTQGSSASVLKRADDAATSYLWKEYYMQSRLFEAMKFVAALSNGISVHASVPTCHFYTNASDGDFWNNQLSHFPSQSCDGGTVAAKNCNTMVSERAPALPEWFRKRLIDNYCPHQLKAKIAQSKSDADSLARLYLGWGCRRARGPSKPSTLRDFPISLNHAEELRLPTLDIAAIMAETLAIMHWEAAMDANGVEFVLGSPPCAQRYRRASILPSDVIAKLAYNSCTRWVEFMNHASPPRSAASALNVWVLDFDRCNLITIDSKGVEKAAAAFYKNDPYFPRPCAASSGDFVLWCHFRDRYLSVSASIVKRKGLPEDLPPKFIERLIELQDQPTKERSFLAQAAYPSHADTPFYNAFL